MKPKKDFCENSAFSIPLFSRTGISPSESHVCAIIVPIPGNKLDAVFTMRSRQLTCQCCDAVYDFSAEDLKGLLKNM